LTTFPARVKLLTQSVALFFIQQFLTLPNERSFSPQWLGLKYCRRFVERTVEVPVCFKWIEKEEKLAHSGADIKRVKSLLEPLKLRQCWDEL